MLVAEDWKYPRHTLNYGEIVDSIIKTIYAYIMIKIILIGLLLYGCTGPLIISDPCTTFGVPTGKCVNIAD